MAESEEYPGTKLSRTERILLAKAAADNESAKQQVPHKHLENQAELAGAAANLGGIGAGIEPNSCSAD